MLTVLEAILLQKGLYASNQGKRTSQTNTSTNRCKKYDESNKNNDKLLINCNYIFPF